jgi:hypothetical protein
MYIMEQKLDKKIINIGGIFYKMLIINLLNKS